MTPNLSTGNALPLLSEYSKVGLKVQCDNGLYNELSLRDYMHTHFGKILLSVHQTSHIRSYDKIMLSGRTTYELKALGNTRDQTKPISLNWVAISNTQQKPRIARTFSAPAATYHWEQPYRCSGKRIFRNQYRKSIKDKNIWMTGGKPHVNVAIVINWSRVQKGCRKPKCVRDG